MRKLILVAALVIGAGLWFAFAVYLKFCAHGANLCH
jgi:hypothetical protein